MTDYLARLPLEGNILPFVRPSMGTTLRTIAQRAVARRLALGWTRQELADRTGIAIDTLKRFERTGHVSLERLLKVALVLDAMHQFEELFPEPVATSLAELEQLRANRARRRGRRRSPQPVVRPPETGAS
jgi:transcriptional regulator with XRE-family HTH domain